MMKTALIAMTVIGCDCDARMCEFVRATPAEWATVGECEEALKSRALRDSNSGYPLLLAICRSTVESPVRLAEFAVDGPASPAIQAQSAVEEPRTRSTLVRASDGYVIARNGVGSIVGGTLGVVRDAGGWLVASAASAF